MLFHDTTNTYDSATHYANSLLGFAEGSTTEYPLAAKARAANTWKYKLALWYWQNQDAWDFDDSALTTFAIARADLVDDQQDYGLPTTALRVKMVEILNSSSLWVRLKPLDEKEVAVSLGEFYKTKGIPVYYRIFSNSLFLYPPPSSTQTTLTNGLRVYSHREINEFTASTTTTEIGFGEPADRIVAVGMALEFAERRGMEVADELITMIYGGIKNGIKVEGLKDQVIDLISHRMEEIDLKIKPTYPFKEPLRYE